jgi:hypothetical protein
MLNPLKTLRQGDSSKSSGDANWLVTVTRRRCHPRYEALMCTTAMTTILAHIYWRL